MSGPKEAATAAAICPLCNSSRWCGRVCKHRLDQIAATPPEPRTPRKRKETRNVRRKPQAA